MRPSVLLCVGFKLSHCKPDGRWLDQDVLLCRDASLPSDRQSCDAAAVCGDVVM